MKGGITIRCYCGGTVVVTVYAAIILNGVTLFDGFQQRKN